MLRFVFNLFSNLLFLCLRDSYTQSTSYMLNVLTQLAGVHVINHTFCGSSSLFRCRRFVRRHVSARLLHPHAGRDLHEGRQQVPNCSRTGLPATSTALQRSSTSLQFETFHITTTSPRSCLLIVGSFLQTNRRKWTTTSSAWCDRTLRKRTSNCRITRAT